MQFFLIAIHAIETFFIFGLGLFTLIKRKSRLNFIFSLICFSITIWIFGTLQILLSVGDESKIIFWDKFVYVGVIFFPMLVYHFSLVFTKKESKLKLFGGYFLVAFFLVINQTSYFADNLYLYKWGGHLQARLFHHIFLLFFLLSIILVNYNIFKYYQKTKNSLKRSQARYILVSFAFLTIGSAGFLPAYGFDIVPLSSLSVMFFVFIIAYTILKYRLMGIGVIASKIYLYISLALFAYGYFYLVAFVENNYFGGIYDSRAMIVGIFFAIIFAVAFLPFLNYIQITSDTLFFRGYNPRKIIKDLVIKLNQVINLNKIFDILFFEFKKILEVEEISILVLKQKSKNNKIKFTEKGYIHSSKIKSSSLIFKMNEIIVRDELKKEDKKITKELGRLKIKIVAPLILQKKTIGYILLGDKITRSGYAQEDIEFLEIISSQAAAAIEKARLHKEIEDFSRGLQKQVESQTQDIRDKTDKLQKLLAMRSEFLDITSHQLRTPVSVIKGVLSMIKEGSVPADKWDEFIDAAFKKSFKLEEIIDEILRASEMDSDQFELSLSPVVVEDIMQEVYEDKLYISKDKGLELILNLPKKPLPLVVSDRKYLKHVVRNLVNNSLQYTHKGTITMSAKKEKNRVAIEVTDTGIGIPKKDVKKLFQKFSRAKNAADSYTDGSGLGLFIIKKIMDGHKGGKVMIKKTEVDKGTTMAIYLPIAKKTNN